MKYFYGDVSLLSPKHLTLLKSVDDVRYNNNNTKFIVKLPENLARHFTGFSNGNVADARAYIDSGAWTGVNWFSNLFGG